MIGLLHDKRDGFEIEPIVIGAPWLESGRASLSTSGCAALGN
jgi:hypothetical protein